MDLSSIRITDHQRLLLLRASPCTRPQAQACPLTFPFSTMALGDRNSQRALVEGRTLISECAGHGPVATQTGSHVKALTITLRVVCLQALGG